MRRMPSAAGGCARGPGRARTIRVRRGMTDRRDERVVARSPWGVAARESGDTRAAGIRPL